MSVKVSCLQTNHLHTNGTRFLESKGDLRLQVSSYTGDNSRRKDALFTIHSQLHASQVIMTKIGQSAKTPT